MHLEIYFSHISEKVNLIALIVYILYVRCCQATHFPLKRLSGFLCDPYGKYWKPLLH